MTKREYLVSEPQGTATASVIWLHGLGADGKDFAGIVDQLGLPKDHSVRFIFPSAPFMNITINNGMLMRAWYDIYDLNMLAREDMQGVKKSQQHIEEFIAHELELGIPSNKILLAGFSQGGAMALYTALNYARPLCGAIVLSAYLPLSNTFAQQQFKHTQMPIFMAHGLYDPVVPYSFGLDSYNMLKQNDYNAEWFSYPMPHTVCLEEIADIGEFMQECLCYA
ncbi:MAG TPA: carboxylesterase [Gammaproteobacteria bacterium]|nr:carboxylesterase [Gammaproteobacteria bacterium]